MPVLYRGSAVPKGKGGTRMESAKRNSIATVHFMCVNKYRLSEGERYVVTLRADLTVFWRKIEVTTENGYAASHSETFYVTIHSETKTRRDVSLRNLLRHDSLRKQNDK